MKIGDLCNLVGGSQPEKSTFISEPKEGYVRLIQTRDYKTDSYKTYIRASATKKYCSDKDVMIGRYGPPVFQILRGLSGAYNVALMKADPKPNVSQEFLYYVLKQSKLFEYIENLSKRTGGQTGIDVDALKNYPVLSPFNETKQFKLIETLYLIDQKIALNNQINAELEAMAKLIYDYWFIQFDFPDENGQPYKSSGGKMFWCEQLKREIPEGWVTKPLSKYVRTSPHKLSKECAFDQIKYLDTGSLTKNIRGEVQELNLGTDQIPSRAKLCVNNLDVLYSTVRPNQHHYGLMIDPEENLIASTGFVVLENRVDPRQNCLIYQFLTSGGSFNRLVKIAETSKSSYPSVTPADILQLQVSFPEDDGLAIRASDILFDFHQQNKVAQRENQELANLRDWLLPLLMNGQVKVSE